MSTSRPTELHATYGKPKKAKPSESESLREQAQKRAFQRMGG